MKAKRRSIYPARFFAFLLTFALLATLVIPGAAFAETEDPDTLPALLNPDP